MTQIAKEMYELYMRKIPVYKLNFRTDTFDILYHEDVNRDIMEAPTYECPGYVDVTDNGLVNLYKQGQQLDRGLMVYMNRKALEDILLGLNFDRYRDVPTDGDVIIIQGVLMEVTTVDPTGYHMNDRDLPFDFQFAVTPWLRSGTPKTATAKPFNRY
jgi:hypothetical protein